MQKAFLMFLKTRREVLLSGNAPTLAKGLILGILIPTFSFFLKGQAYMNDRTELPYPESRTALIEGVRYHYRVFAPEEGTATKANILLIHGFASSTFSWRKLFAPLTGAGYRVLAADIPPFGFSDRSPSVDHSPAANGKRLWELLRREDADKAFLVGHSMGARIAGAMGALKPGRCQKVFLVDGPFFGTGQQRWTQQVAAFFLNRHFVRKLIENLGRRAASDRWIVRRLLSFVYGESPSEKAVKGYMRPLSVRGTGYSLPPYFLERSSIELDLEALTCQVHLIWGEKDRLLKPHMAKQFLNAYPHTAECSLIEGAGHCPMETHPEAFLRVMLKGMKE